MEKRPAGLQQDVSARRASPRLAAGQRPEPATAGARLPEVDLVDVFLAGEEIEPVPVGDGDEGVHSVPSRH